MGNETLVKYRPYMKNGRVVILNLEDGSETVALNRGKSFRSLDISGTTFGQLTANKLKDSFYGDPIWECSCICGKIVEVRLSYLLMELSLSCAGARRKCHSRYRGIAKSMEQNLTGRSFGRLKVTGVLGTFKGRVYYECICECGRIYDALGKSLLEKNTTSCGCLRESLSRDRLTGHKFNLTHGATGSPTYEVWKSMHQRCTNPKHIGYPNYGGRGIGVCERWRSFENFLEDMGERPSQHSIDRKDVNGDYSPDNCRWATQREQSLNKRSNRIIEFRGKKQTLLEWSEELGLAVWVIRNRLLRGWSVERAFTQKVNSR